MEGSKNEGETGLRTGEEICLRFYQRVGHSWDWVIKRSLVINGAL